MAYILVNYIKITQGYSWFVVDINIVDDVFLHRIIAMFNMFQKCSDVSRGHDDKISFIRKKYDCMNQICPFIIEIFL